MNVTNPSAAKTGRVFLRKLFPSLILGVGALGVVAGLMLPVVKQHASRHHRVLPGQFQADIRTMIHGLGYLLRPELTAEKSPAIVPGSNALFAQISAQSTAVLPTLSRNQTSAPAGPLTNPPVQI